MRFSAVIVAAGAGLRAGGDLPKQWRPLLGKPVVRWSAEALRAAGADPLVVVCPAGDEARARMLLGDVQGVILVNGGKARIDSVRAGLAALQADTPEAVLIHDAARPFVTAAHVERLIEALHDADAALPALPVSDTVKRAGPDKRVIETVDRTDLWRAQTPQAFRFDVLTKAYAAWPANETPTDDAGVVERFGGVVALIPGDPLLMKLTYAEDFPMAEKLAEAFGAGAPVARVGQGVDAHRFGDGDSVWLCGVQIPHTQSLLGHSDADAGLHALTDAILGAIGEGDIGDHFPPTDPKWRGVASDQFLAHAVELVRARGGRMINADVTLICERPKITPHAPAMIARLAELLGVGIDRISVKATTTERLGFTGRMEGIAAQAVATILLPN
jgi:2-C-methyl-D-erythritol 4-phosphate cytidylyltransferase/2-C-methyl-D-erythritol 2,4-cyclodiphosphate synthase